MRVGICLGILLCVILLSQPVFAYPEYAENGMNGAISGTDSIEIAVAQHLIEVDFSNPDFIAVQETIIFLNVAGGNYTKDLMTWVPTGANVMSVINQEMNESMSSVSIEYTYDNNILRFNDAERFNAAGMPPMYRISYVVPVAAEGEITDYTKMLVYPTYINYPISSLIVRIIPPAGTDPIITDEGENEIQGDSIESNLDAVVHTWSTPQFKEITIGVKQQSNNSNVLAYILIGFIVLAIFGYSIAQKSIKAKKNSETKPKVKTEKIVATREKDKSNLHELEARYETIISLLNDLKDDVGKGVISEEEYERMSGKRKTEAIDLMKKIDELKD